MFTPTFWGFLSLLLTIAAYAWYFRDTFEKGSRPHILTWLAFGGFTAVGWLVQVKRGAGPGGWAMGISSACCFIISAASVWKQRQEKEQWWKFPWRDWKWLVVALAVFVIYLKLPNHSTLAAVCATAADLASYGPTINQGLRDPYRDCIPAFALNSLKFIPSLVALFILRDVSLATALYPAAVLAMNALVVWVLARGRWQRQSMREGPKLRPAYRSNRDSSL